MSDLSLPTTNRPKHARTTSITTSKNTTSHQRKPSFTSQHNKLLPYHSKSTTELPPLNKSFNSLTSEVRSFLNPSGPPLLPHSKHSQAFGGTSKPSFLQSLLRSRAVRFFALFYVIFSVFLSINHTWNYLTTTNTTTATIDNDWVPQRTYDQDETYSLMNQMTHGLKMHKLFSKSYYEAAKNIQPFWQKASTLVDKDQVTIITSVTPETWEDLKRLTTYWEGPISAILHVQQEDKQKLDDINRDYKNTPELTENVDIHLAVVPGKQFNVLLPRNAERNLARLLATTDTVLDLPIGVLPMTDLQATLQNERIQRLLKAGDLVAIPTFSYTSSSMTPPLPRNKKQLIQQLDEEKIVLDDAHWKPNEGPTDLEQWKVADDMYTVEKYEFHYEPVVVESKSVQPWCSERFLDSRAACIFTSYLQGNEIWVLPNDFMIHYQDKKEVSDFDNVVENRIYAKFYWEQCVFFARQLDSLGLWKTTKSKHIRNQCSRVIQNWGKGLIGKPE